MDEHLYDDLVQEIRDKSTQIPGVLGTEKCFIRKVGMRYFVDLHVMVDGNIPVSKGHDIAHHLKDYLLQEIPNLENVLVHVEPKFKEQNRSSKQGKGSAIKTKKASEATLNEIRKKSRLERKRLQKKKTILLIVLAAVLWLLVIGLVA